jgi:hypothetical protein
MQEPSHRTRLSTRVFTTSAGTGTTAMMMAYCGSKDVRAHAQKGVPGMSDPADLTDLEAEALRMLLRGDYPALAHLRDQTATI